MIRKSKIQLCDVEWRRANIGGSIETSDRILKAIQRIIEISVRLGSAPPICLVESLRTVSILGCQLCRTRWLIGLMARRKLDDMWFLGFKRNSC